MSKLKELSHGTSVLWLDYTGYAGALLAEDKPPWLNTTECIAWLKKSQSLLHSDVVTLPLTQVFDAWIAAHGSLQKSMEATKPRPPLPLRSVLADEGLRQHLAELVTATRAAFPHTVLALSSLSPKLLVPWACQHAGRGGQIEVDDDAVDSATLYMADFLRGFGASGIDVVLLEESASSEPRSADDLHLYQTLFNLGVHYGWEIGLRLPVGNCSENLADGHGFVISPRSPPGVFHGLPVEFFGGEEAMPPTRPAGGFLFAQIPKNANPEKVLERLSAMRRSGATT